MTFLSNFHLRLDLKGSSASPFQKMPSVMKCSGNNPQGRSFIGHRRSCRQFAALSLFLPTAQEEKMNSVLLLLLF